MTANTPDEKKSLLKSAQKLSKVIKAARKEKKE